VTGTPDPRQTRQRRAIADALASAEGFMSAQQLHAELRDQGERIGLATVYRALGRMAANGELDALVGPDGETGYRRCSQGHHHHLVCRRCGRTVEVSGSSVESWTSRVAAQEGFSDVTHTLELVGTCASCTGA
jgi:Fur family ferric uptake transcriptional regulator